MRVAESCSDCGANTVHEVDGLPVGASEYLADRGREQTSKPGHRSAAHLARALVQFETELMV